MASRSLSSKTILLAAGDVGIFALAILSAPFIRNLGAPEPGVLSLYRFAAPFLAALWTAGFATFGLYELKAAKNEPSFYDRMARALAFNFAVPVLLFYLIPEFRLRPLATLFIVFAVQAPLLAAWRAAAHAAFGRMVKDRVLFYGLSGEAALLARYLRRNPQFGYVPVGFLTAGNGGEPPAGGPAGTDALPVFPAGEHLATLVRRERISIIAVAHTIKRTQTLVKALFSVLPLGTAIVDFPRFFEAVEGKVPVSLISETWFLENLIGTRRPKYEFVKRTVDVTLAVVLGAIALALLPAIAIAIVLSTPSDVLRYRQRRARPGDGVIFFRQERVGKGGKVFQFVKFRSQVLGAERHGGEKSEDPIRANPSEAVRGRAGSGVSPDPRAYPLGTLLRKTYLDELPQLWNVIRGDMSFVGPRPERPEFTAELAGRIPFYRMRELVLPGITGWAQINMQNDASVSDAPEKLQYDLYYIRNRSLALDFIIVLKTALKLLQRSGR